MAFDVLTPELNSSLRRGSLKDRSLRVFVASAAYPVRGGARSPFGSGKRRAAGRAGLDAAPSLARQLPADSELPASRVAGVPAGARPARAANDFLGAYPVRSRSRQGCSEAAAVRGHEIHDFGSIFSKSGTERFPKPVALEDGADGISDLVGEILAIRQDEDLG